MKKIFLLTTTAFCLLSFVITGCSRSSEKTTEKQIEEKVIYQCPMDCESGKTYDKPGKCPVCGMELETKV